MPQKIDGFERFRDETLTEREQGLLNAAREPEAKVEAHKEIARERARAQLRDKPALPEEVEPSIRCPGVDPMGRFSIIDMKFAQRMDAVESALSIRSEEVQKRVRAVLQACTTRSTTNPLYAAYSDMQAAAAEHRILTRAGKLCLDSSGREELNRQSRDLEVDPRVVQFDKLMQGIEYLAGVRLEEVPQEIMEFFNTELRVPLSQELAEEGRQVSQQVPQAAMEFKNIENKALLQAMANPHNWDKSWEEVQAISQNTLSVEAVSSGLSPYAAATANRLVTPMFQQMEQYTQGTVNRADLISIDGKTVRELAREQFAASRQAGSFDDFFRQNSVRMTNELVAAGLMAGKRVEAFVPDKYGQVPKEPTQITKSGYEPSPLKPEKFNAWHRFFSKFGYYREKVDRKKEYEKAMAARERVQTRNRAARLKDFAARSNKLKALDMNNLFFNSVLERQEIKHLHHFYAENDWEHIQLCFADHWVEGLFVDLELSRKGRAPCSALVCAMAAQGYQFQDIIDPNKLQRERQDTVVQFVERGLENNQEWMGRTLYKGVKALLQQTDELTRGLDLRNEQQLMSVLPELASISSIAHFALTREDYPLPQACRQAYQDEAVKDLGDAAAAQKHTAEVASLVSNFNSFFNKMLDGKLAQYKLADPATTPEAFLTLDNTKTLIVDRILTSQIKQGNTIFEQVPDSKIISDIATAYYPEQDVTAVWNCLASPENQNLTRELATSGALANALVTKETAPPKKLPSPPVQRSLFMPNPEPVVPPKPQVIPHRAFHVKLELPAPRLEQQAPQRQEPRRQPPQMGGLSF